MHREIRTNVHSFTELKFSGGADIWGSPFPSMNFYKIDDYAKDGGSGECLIVYYDPLRPNVCVWYVMS